MGFNEVYEQWMHQQITAETNPRRRELLERGLGHGTVECLRRIWYPTVGNLDHLFAEWEVRDFLNGYRYIDLAYRPYDAKGGIEIQGFGSHARDLDVRRFKDLCRRHSLLSLDGWTFLSLAYASIIDEPHLCRQMILAFIGKFITQDVEQSLNWLEAELIRYARRLLRPFTPSEAADHLRISAQYARRLLHKLVKLRMLEVSSGQERYRSYQLPNLI